MIRSEVLHVYKDELGFGFVGGYGALHKAVHDQLRAMNIQLKQTVDVRISVEIVEEREEEKVVSKFYIRKRNGAAFLCSDTPSGHYESPMPFRELFEDIKEGETKPVKSILFDTPSGVPLVEFVETARERLQKAVTEFKSLGDMTTFCGKHLVTAAEEVLAEGEGK